MFNIGLIAGISVGPLVKLTGGDMPRWWYTGSEQQSSVRFYPNGTHAIQNSSGGYPLIAGEWISNFSGSNPGADYQVRVSAPEGGFGQALNIGDAINVWHAMTAIRTFGWNNRTGRMLVEIRDTATQTIRASAIFASR